jgi:hypothetical protein
MTAESSQASANRYYASLITQYGKILTLYTFKDSLSRRVENNVADKDVRVATSFRNSLST